MKKSKVIKEIVTVLEKWESCVLDKKCAIEILNKLEKLGMAQDYKDWEHWSKLETKEKNK